MWLVWYQSSEQCRAETCCFHGDITDVVAVSAIDVLVKLMHHHAGHLYGVLLFFVRPLPAGDILTKDMPCHGNRNNFRKAINCHHPCQPPIDFGGIFSDTTTSRPPPPRE